MSTLFFAPLFGSTSAEFLSDYGLQESVERLKAVVKQSVLQTLFEEAAMGKVCPDRVSIWRNTPMFGNSFRPFFIGSFQERSGRVLVAGVFTVHWSVKVFMTFWFGFLGLLTVLLLLAWVGNAANAEVGLLFVFGFFA